MEEQLELWYLDKYAKKARSDAYRAAQRQAAKEPLLPMASPLGDPAPTERQRRGKAPRGAKSPGKLVPTLKPKTGR